MMLVVLFIWGGWSRWSRETLIGLWVITLALNAIGYAMVAGNRAMVGLSAPPGLIGLIETSGMATVACVACYWIGRGLRRLWNRITGRSGPHPAQP